MAELLTSQFRNRSGLTATRSLFCDEDALPLIQRVSWNNPAARISAPVSKSTRFDRATLLLLVVSTTVLVLVAQLFLSDLFTEEAASDMAKSLDLEVSRTGTGPMTSAAFVQSLGLREQKLLLHKANFVADLIKANGRPSIDPKLLARVVVAEGKRNNVDPILVLSVIQSESTFDHRAVSNKGAMGLMQVMPDTAAHIRNAIFSSKGTTSPLLDPETNIRLGVVYLQYLQHMFNGDLRTALVAYNWGPGNVKKALKNKTLFPSGPRAYAEKILKRHLSWRSELDIQLAQNDQTTQRFVG